MTHAPFLQRVTVLDERLGDTSHYRITKGILERPEAYWKHLTDGEPTPP